MERKVPQVVGGRRAGLILAFVVLVVVAVAVAVAVGVA